MDNNLLSVVIGAFSGIIAAVITSMVSSYMGRWKQKRHDYAQLLIALRGKGRIEIIKRLELVALMAPKNIYKKIESMNQEMDKINEPNEEKRKELRDQTYKELREDIQPSWLIRFVFIKLW